MVTSKGFYLKSGASLYPPAGTPTALLFLAACAPAQPAAYARKTFSLAAERGWDSPAIFVRPGDQFEITATGSWNTGLEERPYGPGGTDRLEPDSILPSAPIGALIGRIGDNPPFLIGEHVIQTAEYGGELWLSINGPLEGLSGDPGSLEIAPILTPGTAGPAQRLTNHYGGYLLAYPSEYHTEFSFSVRQFEDGTFRVMELPPYVA